jgi:Ran GTPase-activating protein (RanGAP) involved in mRNA processing and transport
LILQAGLSSNHTLEKLDLQNCELSVKTTYSILDAISNEECLVSELMVGGNRALTGDIKEELELQTRVNRTSHLVRRLTANDDELEEVNLNSVRVHDEGIQPLVVAMHTNTHCLQLFLRITGITNSGVALISQMLKTNKTLEELDLYGNKIGDEAATSLAEALQQNDSLRALNLQNTHINRAGGEALLEMLEDNCTLTQLQLRSTHVPNQMQFRVEGFLRMNDELAELQLQHRALQAAKEASIGGVLDKLTMTSIDEDPNAVRALDWRNPGVHAGRVAKLGNAMQEGIPQLQKVLLVNSRAGDKGAAALATALSGNHCPRLSHLDLTNTNMSCAGAMSLAKALETNTTLHILNLARNDVTDQGADRLISGIHKNVDTAIETMNLSDCLITDTGAELMADTIKDDGTHSLKALMLWQNQISDDGAEAIRIALQSNFRFLIFQLNNISEDLLEQINELVRQNRFLSPIAKNSNQRILDLSYNDEAPAAAKQFSDDFAIRLSLALRKNTHLTKLTLAHHAIGPDGAAALALTLGCYNEKLEQLNLKANCIGEQGAEYFLDCFSQNTTLGHLNLYECQVEKRTMGAVADHCKRNRQRQADVRCRQRELAQSGAGDKD